MEKRLLIVLTMTLIQLNGLISQNNQTNDSSIQQQLEQTQLIIEDVLNVIYSEQGKELEKIKIFQEKQQNDSELMNRIELKRIESQHSNQDYMVEMHDRNRQRNKRKQLERKRGEIKRMDNEIQMELSMNVEDVEKMCRKEGEGRKYKCRIHVEYNHKHELVVNNSNTDYNFTNNSSYNNRDIAHNLSIPLYHNYLNHFTLQFLYRLIQPIDIHVNLFNQTFSAFNYTLKPIVACLDAHLFHSSNLNVSSSLCSHQYLKLLNHSNNTINYSQYSIDIHKNQVLLSFDFIKVLANHSILNVLSQLNAHIQIDLPLINQTNSTNNTNFIFNPRFLVF